VATANIAQTLLTVIVIVVRPQPPAQGDHPGNCDMSCQSTWVLPNLRIPVMSRAKPQTLLGYRNALDSFSGACW